MKRGLSNLLLECKIMHLVLIVVVLLICVVVSIKKALTPKQPPIENLDEHIKYLSSLPNQKARQQYLKHRKPGDK